LTPYYFVRHSVSSYLYAREYDAEEILARLGFGCDTSIDIPVRFLANNNLVSSNSFIDKATVAVVCDDVFVSSVTSTQTVSQAMLILIFIGGVAAAEGYNLCQYLLLHIF